MIDSGGRLTFGARQEIGNQLVSSLATSIKDRFGTEDDAGGLKHCGKRLIHKAVDGAQLVHQFVWSPSESVSLGKDLPLSYWTKLGCQLQWNPLSVKVARGVEKSLSLEMTAYLYDELGASAGVPGVFQGGGAVSAQHGFDIRLTFKNAKAQMEFLAYKQEFVARPEAVAFYHTDLQFNVGLELGWTATWQIGKGSNGDWLKAAGMRLAGELVGSGIGYGAGKLAGNRYSLGDLSNVGRFAGASMGRFASLGAAMKLYPPDVKSEWLNGSTIART